MHPQEGEVARAGWRGSRRDWLILFLLAMATIQCVRADFLVNETFIHWDQYASGAEAMPYQGRVAMMPALRAAARNQTFRTLAHRFAETVTIGSRHQEPFTVEKVASLVAGIAALGAMMATALWWSRRRALKPWWLANLLVLLIACVTLVMRATQNFWYAYDLPHAALFGCAVLFAMEGWWVVAGLLFLIDLPMRETSIFLLPVFVGLARLRRGGKGYQAGTAVALLMLLVWGLERVWIRHALGEGNGGAASHLAENLHDVLMPHHWPQLFSAGGYLAIPVWLERARLSRRDRWVLYSILLCLPLDMLFGVWTETRVWLEWTLPLAALAALELNHWLAGSRPAGSKLAAQE